MTPSVRERSFVAINRWIWSVALIGGLLAGAARAAAPAFKINAPDGKLNSLTLDGRELALPGAGGFAVYDATAKRDLALPSGTLSDAGGMVTFSAANAEIALQASFSAQGDYLLVSGEIENLRHDERGFIVSYWVPRISPSTEFSADLEQRGAMTSEVEQEENVFPIAAMCDQDAAIALAVPPSSPRVFGMVGSSKGLAVRFYLGLSDKPKRFSNRAAFSFIIYGAETAWGFRSALSRYYGFFPDYYAPRLKQHGLFMFQMGARVPTNIDQYGFDLVETQLPTLDAAVARDQQHGLATFPYMIVGQREIKFLPELPKGYDEAMAVFQRWTPKDHAGHALTKENVASEGDIHLKQEVEASACKTADGQYSLVIRSTVWGSNSVSFKMNPNPDLFQDRPMPNVATYAYDLMDRWFKAHPEYAGYFTDSLGANWPAVLNYRPDHFAYARYPLTCDPNGRVALHNEISHYEYLETLRAKARAAGRLMLANGVYCYKSQKGRAGAVERQVKHKKMNEMIAQSAPPEHYRAGTKVGRFFCAALLDVASCEFGIRASVEQCQDIRVIMGRKQFALLNYHWQEAAPVEEFVNKSLCYGIFASTSTDFFSGVEYEKHPNGYLRDKQLIDWFVPLVRRLSQAGWEPARYATVEGKSIACERFGHGDATYLTLYNDGDRSEPCTLRLDLKGLGYAETAVRISEIARQKTLRQSAAGIISLELEPKQTCVIEVSGKPAP